MDPTKRKIPFFIHLLVGTATFMALVLCFTPGKPADKTERHYKGQSILESDPAFPEFIDRTIELGFHTEHRQRDSKLSGLDQASGAGACVLDYDQDGWKDILIIGGSGIGHYFGKPKWWQTNTGNVLYRNIQGQYFEAQTNILPETPSWGMGCTAADFDKDGDPDLFLANKGTNQLLENHDGIFKEVPSENFIDQSVWTQAVAAEDFDHDGLVDLYLVNYVDYAPDKGYLEQSSGYKGTEETLFEPELFEPVANQLLRNLGNMTFEDVTNTSGTQDISGRGVSAEWKDINKDKLPDLLISNDEGSPSKLFINKSDLGDYRFEDASSIYAVASSESQRIMRILNSRDFPGSKILIGGNHHAPSSLLEIDNSGPGLVRELANNGDLSKLAEVTQSIGIGDFNLDGIEDIYLANGLLSPDMDSPSHAQAQSNRLLLGTNKGIYQECETECFKNIQPLSSRHVIVEDFDNDGDLDIFETANNDLVRFLENQQIKPSSKKPASKILFDAPEAKLQIISWLIEDKKTDFAVHELTLLSESRTKGIVISAIRQLARLNRPEALSPLIKALRNENPEIRQAAVLALKTQEADYTGRYLIPLLNDPSESVRCAVADSLSHFYDEEEAMVRSKHLATSVLVKKAQELGESTELCVIKALGKSESYRALNPLLAIADSQNREVKVAALSAIKLLKEQQGIFDLDPTQSEGYTYSQVSEAENQEDRAHSICDADPVLVNAYLNASAKEKRSQREAARNKQVSNDQRLAVLQAVTDQPLLSEYRLAHAIYDDIDDPLRFCSAPVLLSYAPENHLEALIEHIQSSNLSDLERLAIAEAIRQYDSALMCKLVLKEVI